ncbi:MAG: DUF169 domain-containing protein [Desulfarculaceae bacterium]|nr:DUF169 domain-containing protein [Desulfarculaceae bacterium]MCF8072442.1 DUF169 domain-containing protein [Desulfarculaceae bacterium]MCF8102903.1 DUF169 domain-containing protein [Desulfarculaceae bacterium]MCF8118485.1 DUF169 domain-containing protein [Desulfarculaceae bacterium]
MSDDSYPKLTGFLQALGLDEEPLGLFYTDTEPAEGFTPRPLDLPTRQKEIDQQIDWQEVFGNFSCVMGHIWRARKKKRPAYFSAGQFGCPGGSFWLGFNKPQTEAIIAYVSSGIPGVFEGEFYCESPDELRSIFEYADPRSAPAKYCVVQPLSLFTPEQTPELIIFFARPESMSGLHQLAAFVTNDPEVVASPWGAACGGIAAWPLHYLGKNQTRAVVGGWDPSARKFFNTDELSFTVPLAMFQDMLARYEESFLSTKTWATVQKKIARSKKAWS